MAVMGSRANKVGVCSSGFCKKLLSWREQPTIVSEIAYTNGARFFIPNIGSKPAELYTPIRPERRRTPRKHIPIPLFVYGHTPEGHTFYEETFTNAVNVHGGSMRMQAGVQLGQRLLVTNQKNEYELPCIIVFLGERLAAGIDVAFSFTAAMPQFWRVPGKGKRNAPEIGWDYEEFTPAGHALGLASDL
jgi:hypothetical protein